MPQQQLLSQMGDEVLRTIGGEEQDRLASFDSEFVHETSSFVAHIARTYIKLGVILSRSEKPRPYHWFLAATYVLNAVNSLLSAFMVLRSGFPVQALDLLRRVIETTCAAVYICDHPKVVSDPQLSRLPGGRCVSYARKHLPNVGRAYGTFSFFDHSHSAMLTPFLTVDVGRRRKIGYPLGPCPLQERPSLFRFAVLQIAAHAHNVEAVTEMLFFSGLEGQKRFWVPAVSGLQYDPIKEERRCEEETVSALKQLEAILRQELLSTAPGHEGR